MEGCSLLHPFHVKRGISTSFERKKKVGACVGSSLSTMTKPVFVGEYWALCERYEGRACMLIALNIYFGVRLYDTLKEFAESIPKRIYRETVDPESILAKASGEVAVGGITYSKTVLVQSRGPTTSRPNKDHYLAIFNRIEDEEW